MGGRRLREDQKESIRKQVKAGVPMMELAVKYKVAHETIRRICMPAESQKNWEQKDWPEQFKKEWANIYPGDEVRNERAKKALNKQGTV